MSRLFNCKKNGKLILEECLDSSCDWYINCPLFCNCSTVASNFGPFSNTEIGVMMGISGEWVRQIEQNALRKLKRASTRINIKSGGGDNGGFDSFQ